MKGLDGLVTPYTTTEFQAMAELLRGHHHAVHDQMVVVAAELRRMLGRIQGAPGLFGVDSKIAARRVTRHLSVAAGLNLATAKAAIRAYQVYMEMYVNPSAGSHGRGFDPTK